MGSKKHAYVGWKDVRGWTCIRCGECCRRYIIQLSQGEVLYYNAKYGPVAVGYRGKYYLMKKYDGSCIFLDYEEGKAKCLIYHNRPRVCRMYPFLVTRKPINREGEDAEIRLGERRIYLYVDAVCPGVNTAENIYYLIGKVIEKWLHYFG